MQTGADTGGGSYSRYPTSSYPEMMISLQEPSGTVFLKLIGSDECWLDLLSWRRQLFSEMQVKRLSQWLKGITRKRENEAPKIST